MLGVGTGPIEAYTLHILGPDGRPRETFRIDAQSDARAIKEAGAVIGEREHAELWLGERLVAKLDLDGPPYMSLPLRDT